MWLNLLVQESVLAPVPLTSDTLNAVGRNPTKKVCSVFFTLPFLTCCYRLSLRLYQLSRAHMSPTPPKPSVVSAIRNTQLFGSRQKFSMQRKVSSGYVAPNVNVTLPDSIAVAECEGIRIGLQRLCLTRHRSWSS